MGRIAAPARFTGALGDVEALCPGRRRSVPVLDLVYIGLTIVVFSALWLLVKGVERFER